MFNFLLIQMTSFNQFIEQFTQKNLQYHDKQTRSLFIRVRKAGYNYLHTLGV